MTKWYCLPTRDQANERKEDGASGHLRTASDALIDGVGRCFMTGQPSLAWRAWVKLTREVRLG